MKRTHVLYDLGELARSYADTADEFDRIAEEIGMCPRLKALGKDRSEMKRDLISTIRNVLQELSRDRI